MGIFRDNIITLKEKEIKKLLIKHGYKKNRKGDWLKDKEKISITEDEFIIFIKMNSKHYSRIWSEPIQEINLRELDIRLKLYEIKEKRGTFEKGFSILGK